MNEQNEGGSSTAGERAAPMRPRDAIRYLAFSGDAARRIAGSRGALLVGAVFVAIAGVARNYDHVFLLHEARWLIGPFAFSLVSTTMVYLSAQGIGGVGRVRREAGRHFGSGFGAMLALFWMTAPCAWLYAIPVERWAEPFLAAKLNFALLGAVAAWRVALISRALVAITGVPPARAVVAVFIPASLEAAVALFLAAALADLDLASVMAGLQAAAVDRWQINTTATLSVWSLVTFLLSLIGLAAINETRRAARDLPVPSAKCRLSLPLASMALAAAAICLAIAIPEQFKLRRHDIVESLIWGDREREALDFLSKHGRDDFSQVVPVPPNAWRSGAYRLPGVLQAVAGDDPDWVKAHLLEQSKIFLRRAFASDTTFFRQRERLGIVRTEMKRIWGEGAIPAEFEAKWQAYEKRYYGE
ncbi:MAG: hypothetical protein R3F11_05245 [Verrucomicrobiales bacterium]